MKMDKLTTEMKEYVCDNICRWPRDSKSELERNGGAYIMSAEEYKSVIVKMLQKLDESDHLFLRQIYTIMKKHLERKRLRNDGE